MKQSIWWVLTNYIVPGNCIADMMKLANDPNFDSESVVIVFFAFNDLVNNTGAIVEPPDLLQQFEALCTLVRTAQRVVMLAGGTSDIYGFGPEWDDYVI